MAEPQIKLFDLIVIKKIDNIKWVSGPAGRPAKPSGVWQVIGAIDNGQIIIASKDETVIQVPMLDILKYGDYNLDKVKEEIKKIRTLKDLGDRDETGRKDQK